MSARAGEALRGDGLTRRAIVSTPGLLDRENAARMGGHDLGVDCRVAPGPIDRWPADSGGEGRGGRNPFAPPPPARAWPGWLVSAVMLAGILACGWQFGRMMGVW